MARRRPGEGVYRLLWARLSYQFDFEVANALLEPREELEVSLSGSGRVRHVWKAGRLILTFRAGDALASLTLDGAELVRRSSEPPRYRVVVRRGSVIHGSVFPRQVVGGDFGLRVGDEVLVVDEDDRLLAVGRLRIPLTLIRGLSRGEVVRVR
ncbi:MAG: hypothetical protein F7B17_06040 [Desulfurococcales archaeon]|nr:hypothetical protein [Desulfurococcales archaeon]